jgi:hypothetical protein
VIPTGSGKNFTADGATFTLTPTGSHINSSAGFTRVGSYQLGGTVTSGSSNNFNNNLVVVGSLEVSSIGLTASANGVSKVYDGTTSMSGVTLGLSTLKGGDVVTVNGLGAFSSRNVGTNLSYSISGLSLFGADAGNYHLTGGSSFSGSNGQITRASATVTGTATNLTYNGLMQNQIAATSSGFIAGDSITISGAASGKGAGTYQSNLTVGGTDVGNYSVTVANANLLIGQANLTLSGTRTYDGGTTFSGQYLTATGVNGETFTVTGAGNSSNLASKNVSANPNGTTLSSVDGLNLGISSNGGRSANYNALSAAGSSISVTKANLSVMATPSLSGNTYNGSAFSAPYTTTVLSGDAASLIVNGLASGTDAGTYTSNLVVSGPAMANYNTPTITNADLVISPKAVTVTNTSQSTTYDGVSTYGSLAAGMSFTTSTLVGRDAVASVTQSANGVTTGAIAQAGSFTVTPSAAMMGTGLASNYSFSYVAGSHSVNKANLTVTANNASKTYDAQPYSGGAGVTYSGLVNSETAAVLSGSLRYSGSSQGAVNAGTYTIIPGGLSSANYTLSYINGSLVINRAGLSAVSGSLTGLVGKVYDGTSAATLSSGNFVINGWLGSDGATVTKTSGTYDNANAGSGKTVTVNLSASDYAPNGSTVLANYTLPTSISGAVGSITPAVLVISGITASDKVYDGNASAVINTTGAVKAGLITGDVVNVVASGAFADKNVGNGKAVSITGVALNGPDAGNYRLVSSSASAAANISKANLLVTGSTANDKMFDGTSSAIVTGGRISPIGGDVVSLSAANATFSDASIGINKLVSTFYALTGADAGNYTVVQPNGLTASINPNPVSAPSVQQLVVVPAVTVSIVAPRTSLVTVSSSAPVTPAGTSNTTSTIAGGNQPSVDSTPATVSSPSTAPATPGTTASSGTVTSSILSSSTTTPSGTGSPIAVEIKGSITPIGLSTSSGGTSNQGTASFVAVNTFDIVKIAPDTTANLTLPDNTFIHSVSSTPLQISATTAGGSPLPDWVKFSPGERRFIVTPPAGMTSLQVVVVATDTAGNQASTTLTLQFGDPSR